MDALGILMDAQTHDENFDAEYWLDRHAIFKGVPEADINGFLAGIAGYFMDVCRRPAPSGMPSIRAFQRLQGESLIGWLTQRLP
jgi:hypothetical protein